MNNPSTVFLLNVSGEDGAALALVAKRYPGASIKQLPKDSLLQQGVLAQARAFSKMRGAALVLFFDDVELISEKYVKLASGLFHRCRETVLADERQRVAVYTRARLLLQVPAILWSACADAFTLAAFAVGLRLLLVARPSEPQQAHEAAAKKSTGVHEKVRRLSCY